MTDKNFDADGKIRTRVVSTMTLVKNLEGYVVKLSKFAKCEQILKNSVASEENAIEKVFPIKDRTAARKMVWLRMPVVKWIVGF